MTSPKSHIFEAEIEKWGDYLEIRGIKSIGIQSNKYKN
jgi:hypothetical protein